MITVIAMKPPPGEREGVSQRFESHDEKVGLRKRSEGNPPGSSDLPLRNESLVSEPAREFVFVY